MSLRSCIITLLVVYPVLLAAGVWLFIYLQKKHPVPKEDPRYVLAKPLRFLLFVLLVPIGVTITFALFGWLDPLFFAIQHFRAVH